MKSKFPYLDPSYKFGIIYYDGQMNDSRMNIDLLLTSSLQNYQEGFQKADILNYTEFKKFNKNSNG